MPYTKLVEMVIFSGRVGKRINRNLTPMKDSFYINHGSTTAIRTKTWSNNVRITCPARYKCIQVNTTILSGYNEYTITSRRTSPPKTNKAKTTANAHVSNMDNPITDKSKYSTPKMIISQPYYSGKPHQIVLPKLVESKRNIT